MVSHMVIKHAPYSIVSFQKFGGSDSDDTDEEGSYDTEEREKSVVLNNGNHSDSSKEADGSSGSVTGGKQDEFSGGASSE